MLTKRHFLLMVLLTISALILVELMVVELVEYRHYSNPQNTSIVWLSIFLAGLSLCSLCLLPFIFQQHHHAYQVSVLLSITYIMFYIFDLSHLFPQPISTISLYLFWTEIMGLLLAVPLLMLSIDLVSSPD